MRDLSKEMENLESLPPEERERVIDALLKAQQEQMKRMQNIQQEVEEQAEMVAQADNVVPLYKNKEPEQKQENPETVAAEKASFNELLEFYSLFAVPMSNELKPLIAKCEQILSKGSEQNGRLDLSHLKEIAKIKRPFDAILSYYFVKYVISEEVNAGVGITESIRQQIAKNKGGE